MISVSSMENLLSCKCWQAQTASLLDSSETRPVLFHIPCWRHYRIPPPLTQTPSPSHTTYQITVWHFKQTSCLTARSRGKNGIPHTLIIPAKILWIKRNNYIWNKYYFCFRAIHIFTFWKILITNFLHNWNNHNMPRHFFLLWF